MVLTDDSRPAYLATRHAEAGDPLDRPNAPGAPTDL